MQASVELKDMLKSRETTKNCRKVDLNDQNCAPQEVKKSGTKKRIKTELKFATFKKVYQT